MTTERRQNFFTRFFVPRRDYVVTPVIFYLNFIMFIVVSLYDNNFWYPSPKTLLLFGADTPSLTLGGEWWRMFTACFLHIGILHFAANMFAMLQLGLILENFVGSLRLAAGYIFFGIAGNVASNWWYADRYLSLSAGASGAIFGLLGFFLALITTEFVKKESRGPLLKSIGITILINVLISLDSHINAAAHFGGLAAGIVSGYLIWILYKLNLPKRDVLFSGMMAVFCAILIFVVLPFVPDTVVKVHEFVERLEQEEKNFFAETDQKIKSNTISFSETKSLDTEYAKLIKRTDSLNAITKAEETPQVIQGLKMKFALGHDILVYRLRKEAGDKEADSKLKELEQKRKEMETEEEI